jgi:hypothetical protein
MRLVAIGAVHHHFQDRLFYRQHYHVVDIRGLLLAQIVEVLFKALLDYFLILSLLILFRSLYLFNCKADESQGAYGRGVHRSYPTF